MRKLRVAFIGAAIVLMNLLFMNFDYPDQTTAIVEALRLDAMVTGGATPYNDSAGVFQGMVNAINQPTPNYVAAATLAVKSSLFQYYLPRRMAKEMMSPQLSEAGIPDNAATSLIFANFTGAGGTTPSLKNIWTQNATYCLKLPIDWASEGQAAATGCPSGQFYPYYLQQQYLYYIDWTTALVANTGQVSDPGGGGSPTKIGANDVGGFMTVLDNNTGGPVGTSTGSFVNFAFTGGTNLRAVEALYEISMGLTLQQMESTTNVTGATAPLFVPSDNPNFTTGQGQVACIACHGGGVSNLKHGYAVFADTFDWDVSAGYRYFPNPIYTPNPALNNGNTTNDPAEGLGKSFGSNPDTRVAVFNCIANPSTQTTLGTVCNPGSAGMSQTKQWDLTSWQQSGLLAQMGWTYPTVSGNGLNSLATAVGQAGLTYQFMVQRMIGEICPLGTFSSDQIAAIASQAQTIDNSTGTQPIGPYAYIVTQVAANSSCL